MPTVSRFVQQGTSQSWRSCAGSDRRVDEEDAQGAAAVKKRQAASHSASKSETAGGNQQCPGAAANSGDGRAPPSLHAGRSFRLRAARMPPLGGMDCRPQVGSLHSWRCAQEQCRLWPPAEGIVGGCSTGHLEPGDAGRRFAVLQVAVLGRGTPVRAISC